MKCSSHWLEALPVVESLDILRDLARSHAEEVDSPLGRSIVAAIHRGDYRSLCGFEIDYAAEGLNAHAVRHLRQALAFFQKLQYLDIGIDREEVGMQTFLEAERLCSETNSRLLARRAGTLGFPARVDAAFLAAQRKIRRVLREVPLLETLTLRFGPGSTRKSRKADASIRRKCAEGITCSEELLALVPTMLRELPSLSSENAAMSWIDEDGDEWDRVDVELHTSKLCFVFKNAKTFRLIGIEPTLNLMYQLGYGDYIARRLAAFGVDIRDQSPNQRRAKEGSLTGALATLDLSSASDTISKELVYELLPLDWACTLARGRSGDIEIPTGSTIRQSKFSAMGNGFTFPLETLIFWALAASVCDNDADVTVYGDDIVVPSDKFSDVSEVLRYAGFNVNLKKSYATTPFRESCGKDYFEGIDVRPYYQKEWVSGMSLFTLHNWYVRHEDYERAKYVVNLIHPSLLVYGPDGYGDGHLIGDHPYRRSVSQERKGYSGYFFESFTTKSRKEVREDLDTMRGDYPASLYSVYVRGDVQPGQVNAVRHYRASDDSSFIDVLIRGVTAETIDSALGPIGLPISEDDSGRKAWSLPGVDGYKKIKIYKLRG